MSRRYTRTFKCLVCGEGFSIVAQSGYSKGLEHGGLLCSKPCSELMSYWPGDVSPISRVLGIEYQVSDRIKNGNVHTNTDITQSN